jgi:hypothetical protein
MEVAGWTILVIILLHARYSFVREMLLKLFTLSYSLGVHISNFIGDKS